jgi:hypothetical protein
MGAVEAAFDCVQTTCQSVPDLSTITRTKGAALSTMAPDLLQTASAGGKVGVAQTCVISLVEDGAEFRAGKINRKEYIERVVAKALRGGFQGVAFGGAIAAVFATSATAAAAMSAAAPIVATAATAAAVYRLKNGLQKLCSAITEAEVLKAIKKHSKAVNRALEQASDVITVQPRAIVAPDTSRIYRPDKTSLRKIISPRARSPSIRARIRTSSSGAITTDSSQKFKLG